jgi:hypothetical protein
MITRRVSRLTAVAALATSMIGLAVGTAATASAVSSFSCSDSGTGPDLYTAQHNAELNLRGDYTVLSGFTLAYDTQEPDGSWYAVVSARCGNPR